MGKKHFPILVIMFLVACEATPVPTATTIVAQNLATSLELETTVVSWITDYYADHGRATLHLEIFSQEELFSRINSGKVELAILADEPPEDWFVTPLMREAIVVIVNPGLSIQSLSLQNLEEIFSGKIKTWETLADVETEVQLVIPFKGSSFRDRFDQVIMKNSIFDPSSLLASTPQDVLDFVRSNQGAIGFLPVGQLGEGVEIVEIDAIAPGESEINDDQYPLWVEIIATSPQDPVRYLRDFLGWLQGTYLTKQ